ncbi:MAG: hypothetical protein AAGG09_06630 [Pseudomonadota bacterium]
MYDEMVETGLAGIVPVNWFGGGEYRSCAVLRRSTGEALALQVLSTIQPASVSVFLNRDHGKGTWDRPALLASGLAVPAALAQGAAPVIARDTAKELVILWPLERDGLLRIDGAEVSVLSLPGGETATALAQMGAETLIAAQADDGTLSVFALGAKGEVRPVPAGAIEAGAHGRITALASLDKQIYAAVSDARAGFTLWRAGPDRWEPVLTAGAFRYGASPRVSVMAAIGGRLCVAVEGADTDALQIGDEYPEILTVDADGSWSILSGQARFTPDGLKLPEAPGGPGVPAFAGMRIGGLDADEEGMIAWVTATGAGEEPGALLRFEPSEPAWSEACELPAPITNITSILRQGDGSFLIAAASDGAQEAGMEGAGALVVRHVAERISATAPPRDADDKKTPFFLSRASRRD